MTGRTLPRTVWVRSDRSPATMVAGSSPRDCTARITLPLDRDLWPATLISFLHRLTGELPLDRDLWPATRFVEEGAYVFITGRNAGDLEKAKATIGRNVTTVQGDIANLADLDRLYDTVRAERGHLDIVVANAAFIEERTLAEVTPEHFDKTFGVNARGTLFTVQKALPLMRDGGSVVLMSSENRLVGVPNLTTYAATKAAIRSFARNWAADLKDRRIRVNSLTPGPIDTPIVAEMAGSEERASQLKEGVKALIPLARMGRPEEVAAAALSLASDESSYTTGSDLVVDGGHTQI